MATYEQTAEMIWNKYQRGLDQGRISGRYNNAEKCWRFYEGDQWAGIQNADGNLPFYNIVQPVVDYKKARVCMNNKTITLSIKERDPHGLMDAINEQLKEAWEFGGMDDRCWEMVEEAMVGGDAFIYFPHGSLFTQGEKLCRCNERRQFSQIFDGCRVFLGDEEEPNLQNQPYIIVEERRLLDQVRDEAKRNGISEDEIGNITADNRSDAEITTDDALKNDHGDQYCTTVLYFERVNEGIRYCRAVKDLIYQPYQVINGLQYYPMVSYSVRRKKGSARGAGEVLRMIPNQIEINKTLVRRSDAVRRLAYPKMVYSKTFISNAGDLDTPGAAIELNDDVNVDDVFKKVGYIQAPQASGEATALEGELMTNTKELAGAGDSALGNINPEQASGAAIAAVQDQADIPLNRAMAAFQKMVEEIAILWFHMIIAYNPIEYHGTEKVASNELKKLCPKVDVTVSPTLPDTVLARVNNLYNLLGAGHITFEEFIELAEDDSNLPLQKIKAMREEIMEQQADDIERETQETQLSAQMTENEAGGMFAGLMGG